jgi:hypothetical protein
MASAEPRCSRASAAQVGSRHARAGERQLVRLGTPWARTSNPRIKVSDRRFRFDHNFEPRNNKLMESADSRPRLPSRWAGVEAKLPPALDQLVGPADGVVELPLDLAWSGDRRFDLADPVQRYLYHMTVLTSAVTREHYTRWLNASLICGDWSRLRLPRALRETWQAHFPELGPE